MTIKPLPRLAGIATLSVVFLVSFLVGVGGLICLWRDRREELGRPDIFAAYANRVHPDGLLRRVGLRFLQGSELRSGDIVQVNNISEIVKTLDDDRTVDGLPFMREMEPFCGKLFRVHRQIDKINDMRNKTGLRRMRNAVTLADVRCSGAQHGDCQAECQIIWKDAWLTRLPDSKNDVECQKVRRGSYSLSDDDERSVDDQTYSCQMTALWEASQEMSKVDLRQDLRSLLGGNIGAVPFLLAMFTRLFNLVQTWRGGNSYPYMPREASKGRSPSCALKLNSRDPVIIRSKEEIADTLVDGRNRGLWYDRDMIRFSNQPATVKKRVSRVIDERTGKMVNMKTPCLVIENVVGTGEFLRFCPQHEYIFWREIWLQPADNGRQKPRSLVSDISPRPHK
jgi:hypothetical protein